ncbi:hypothetical protein KB553_10025 [Chryseobacterium rhizoplanae]|uniref:hypothetical protein n=1 Tax=Chryseobacterium rhizoplanae TaxID=1609531 RepID=UPI001CE37E95|nr:hypothetical protein [Chryseobacterium rhizoplanae]UCA61835.1 hypothetical protein KB553_10025 [Chryseobacterium rhizoplanae]
MKLLNPNQLKSDPKKENISRLSLDVFKKQFSNVQRKEELEKLAGGILGACHFVKNDDSLEYKNFTTN